MKRWVLKYNIGEMSIYLTPHNAHSVHLKDAITFLEESNCIAYKGVNKSFLEFEPSLEEIPEYKNSCLLND